MDTQDLRVFLAVVDYKSFSEAAEQIHVSQPAVSKRIANLESHLDTKLFDRISRKVFLTEAGELLLPKARGILNELENTRQEINALSGDISGTLSLAISHHLGLHRLPNLLKTFADRHRSIELDVHFSDSEKAYEGIAQGQFDLAVNTLSPEEKPRITALPLWRDKLCFVCAENHPLANSRNIDLTELSNYRCLVPDLSTFTGRLLKDLFTRKGLALKPVMSTNFLQTLSKMTEIGLGWSLLPRTLVTEHMVTLPIDVELSRELGIIYHSERTLSAAAREFISICGSEADFLSVSAMTHLL